MRTSARSIALQPTGWLSDEAAPRGGGAHRYRTRAVRFHRLCKEMERLKYELLQIHATAGCLATKQLLTPPPKKNKQQCVRESRADPSERRRQNRQLSLKRLIIAGNHVEIMLSVSCLLGCEAARRCLPFLHLLTHFLLDEEKPPACARNRNQPTACTRQLPCARPQQDPKFVKQNPFFFSMYVEIPQTEFPPRSREVQILTLTSLFDNINTKPSGGLVFFNFYSREKKNKKNVISNICSEITCKGIVCN